MSMLGRELSNFKGLVWRESVDSLLDGCSTVIDCGLDILWGLGCVVGLHRYD